jgi:hypothetical protein
VPAPEVGPQKNEERDDRQGQKNEEKLRVRHAPLYPPRERQRDSAGAAAASASVAAVGSTTRTRSR